MLSLGWRQKLNMFSRPRSSAPGKRIATAHKTDRKAALPLVFGCLMLLMSFSMCHQAVHGLARYAYLHWPAVMGDGDVIELKGMEHWRLERYVDVLEMIPTDGSNNAMWESNRSKSLEQMVETIREDRGMDEASARAEADRLLAHHDQFGMDGFVREGLRSRRSGSLDRLSEQAITWFGRVIGMTLICLFAGITLLPLSARTKDLGSLDTHLEWLYCLPLSGREILSGRFLSMTFVRPIAWIILLPLSSTLFMAMGYVVTGVVLGLGVTLALSASATGIELAAETWLRSGGSFRLKKNVQAFATVVGTFGLFIGMGAGFAAERSADWVNWILDHTPVWVTAGPGYLIRLPLAGPDGLVRLAVALSLMMMVCGLGGWLFAAWALKRGLVSGNGREGVRTGEAALARSGSLVRFEWLLLLRDRNLAILVLVMPVMLVGYQLLINPGLVAVANARNLAAISFGCGVWAATMTAPHVVASEANSMWVVFSLPVEIAGYFRRRMQVWRTTGVLMTIGVMAGLVAWKGGVPPDDWWRLPSAVAGVWVMSFVVYTIIMGGTRLPDPTRGDRLKVGVLRMYVCMTLGGIVGTLIWGGTAWQVFSGLVIWWFFGFSLWQGVVRKLRYLLEPTVDALPKLSVAHALVAVVIFFAVQGLFALTGLVLLSYSVAGIVTALYCAISLSCLSIPKVSRGVSKLAIDLPLAMLVCVAVGAIWVLVLRHVSPFREFYESAQGNATVVLDPRGWQVVLLLVVAAPLIEEFMFRGYILRIMQTAWSPRMAIFASALLFAVVHPGLSFPPVFLLGLATAWLYTRSGRLWPGMVLHAVYNGVIVAIGW